jgi:hypothetical protein
MDMFGLILIVLSIISFYCLYRYEVVGLWTFCLPAGIAFIHEDKGFGVVIGLIFLCIGIWAYYQIYEHYRQIK